MYESRRCSYWRLLGLENKKYESTVSSRWKAALLLLIVISVGTTVVGYFFSNWYIQTLCFLSCWGFTVWYCISAFNSSRFWHDGVRAKCKFYNRAYTYHGSFIILVASLMAKWSLDPSVNMAQVFWTILLWYLVISIFLVYSLPNLINMVSLLEKVSAFVHWSWMLLQYSPVHLHAAISGKTHGQGRCCFWVKKQTLFKYHKTPLICTVSCSIVL